ncbi:MAG: FliA/WhiG family RNA polymerase sigma factor [Acidobacteriia bacterium]|nr:FliA/WhiG family RNA polymerase sigma factor [Terriglobia bacterium]
MRAESVSLRRRKVSLQVRDRIVLEHLTLVKVIAIRVHENLPVHVDLDDLIHAGVLGLFDAIEKFDATKNVAFQSYAKHRIKGAILDSLRQLDWASRDMRKRQKQMEAATRNLSLQLGRMPTEGEVAQYMGVEVEKWRRMLVEMRTVGLISTNSRSDEDHDRTQDFPAAPDSRPDRMCAHRQLQVTLARAMKQLPERYQKVVFMYYTNDMTMKEIGELLGVNESRVSQIHKTALRKMADALQSEGIHSAQAF